ncbi:MAG: Lacal_2735 family protein, partial [Bacteroidia bacterium]|nr:Lacal_2735 family protein [Bacteroidia bacterium]
EKLMKESYKLSTVNRTASDAKAAEADAILKEIEDLDG